MGQNQKHGRMDGWPDRRLGLNAGDHDPEAGNDALSVGLVLFVGAAGVVFGVRESAAQDVDRRRPARIESGDAVGTDI